MGDKLYVSRNHICSGGITGGLKLSGTSGAEISCNIINDNILIRYSKGVSFFSNHCENGAQIEVSRSQVDFSNNYFHKGQKPTFLFHDRESDSITNSMASSILLQNNVLIFMDNETDDMTLPVSQTSQYDIQTDGLVSLDIQNSYRYQLFRNHAGNIQTFGLAIEKKCWNATAKEYYFEPFTEFNNLSYLLSNKCLIKPKFYLAPNHLMKTSQKIGIGAQTNSAIKWMEQTGSCSYSAQTIWDKKRLIGSETETLYKNRETGEIWFACNDTQGMLFGILESTSNGNGNQGIIRFARTHINSSGTLLRVAEVPICGATYLYDNGISVAGFKWEEQYPISLSVNTNISSVHFVGDNVICTGTSCPLYGTWTVGDIVYNTGTTSTNAMWIYTANGWQAR